MVTAPFRSLSRWTCAGLLALALARGEQAVTAGSSAELPPEIAALLANQSSWNNTASVQVSLGYRDNLLLSHVNTEGSGFVRGGVETFLWHPPRDRIDYFAFISADGTRYFSGQTVDHEAIATAQAEWRYRIGDVFQFNADLQGYYLDQIFDFSDTEVQRVVAEQKISGVTIGPTIRWSFLPSAWIEAQGVAKRETFRDGLNNSRIDEATARLGWHSGKRLELIAAAAARRRDFDHRVQYSIGGRPLTGTALLINEREGELRLNATLDRTGHWKTTTRASTLRYFDNGSGYFNYHEHKLTQKLEWSAGDWLVQFQGRAKRLDFDRRTVGLGIAPPPRIKDEFSAELHVELKLSARWTALAEYRWERNHCNDSIASYKMNEALLGARWSWEK